MFHHIFYTRVGDGARIAPRNGSAACVSGQLDAALPPETPDRRTCATHSRPFGGTRWTPRLYRTRAGVPLLLLQRTTWLVRGLSLKQGLQCRRVAVSSSSTEWHPVELGRAHSPAKCQVRCVIRFSNAKKGYPDWNSPSTDWSLRSKNAWTWKTFESVAGNFLLAAKAFTTRSEAEGRRTRTQQ